MPASIAKDAVAKAEWKRITPELHRLELLCNLDQTVLTLYCEWVSASRALSKEIREDGFTVQGARGENDVRKHPAWQMYREATAMVATLAKELGVSPNGRARMGATEGEGGRGLPGDPDDFD